MVSKFHRNSVVRGDETRGKRSFPPPMNPLSISRLFHQRALLERATRVLYVCFSFPVEKSLIIGHGNAKWAEGYFSLLRIYNALVQSTNPFIPSFPLHLKTSFFTTTVTILVLIKKRGGKKRGRKKPRGLIKWRQQCSPSVSPGIFYHEGYRNSHNQRLLSRVNSKLPLASTILFRHIPLTVYPNFIAFAAVSSGVNSKKNSTQWYLKFRYVSCSRSLIFKIFVSRAFTRRVLYRIKGSIFAFNTVASLYLCGSIMVGQARERNFNGPGIYLWVRGNGSPRNNATRRERERGEEKRKKE